MDGFDDCIIGICESFGGESVVAYAYDKVIAKLESKLAKRRKQLGG